MTDFLTAASSLLTEPKFLVVFVPGLVILMAGLLVDRGQS